MARTNNLNNFLTDVANSIRNKTGSQESIQASDFDTEIANIPTGGTSNLQSKDVSILKNGVTTITADEGYDGLSDVDVTVAVPTIDTSDATATPKDLPSGKTAYVKGEKITGIAGLLPLVKSTNIATFARADLFHDGSEVPLVNAKGNIKLETKNGVPLIGMITPSLAKDPDTGSDVLGLHIEGPKTAVSIKQSTMAERLNIIPTNLKKGVTILGVTGTYEGSSEYNGKFISFVTGNALRISNYISEIPSLDLSNVTSLQSMFSGCTSLTTIPLLDTSNVTDMYLMFQSCSSLTTIPLLDTSNVTNTSSMFQSCSSLTTIPLLDIGKSTNTSGMFSGCTSLTTIPLLDTSSATNTSNMFSGCTSLTAIPLLDIGKSTNTSGMFYNCSSLTTIPLLNTSSVTNTSSMFYNCSSLTTIPLLDIGKSTNTSNMFSGCSSLTTIPLLDTSSVTNTSGMFNHCTSLTTIPLLDTSSATNMSNMFNYCTSLTTIPLLDTSSATNMSNMFSYSNNLTDTSLDNILQMCIGATSYTGTKTLLRLGFSSSKYPVARIQALPHYQDFIDAGWTIGY